MSLQVKSKQRVADHGEVYTNEREVKAMVDLVWENFISPDKKVKATFLEPACGNGNFLVEILQRKLEVIKKHFGKTQVGYEMALISAISSIYGVELLQDNTEECRERLYRLILKNYPKKYQDTERFPKMKQSIGCILQTNIICGDALNYTTADGEPIIFIDWSIQPDGIVIRNAFDYREISKVTDGVGSLFGELAADAPLPITHYLNLHHSNPISCRYE